MVEWYKTSQMVAKCVVPCCPLLSLSANRPKSSQKCRNVSHMVRYAYRQYGVSSPCWAGDGGTVSSMVLMGCRAAPVLLSRGRDLGVQLSNADTFYIRLQNALFFIPIVPSFVPRINDITHTCWYRPRSPLWCRHEKISWNGDGGLERVEGSRWTKELDTQA